MKGCKNCFDGYLSEEIVEYVTEDMAKDAGDPSLAGSVFRKHIHYSLCPCCHGSFDACKACDTEHWVNRYKNCSPYKFPIELWDNGKCSRCGDTIKDTGHVCKDIIALLKEEDK
jgi:hypothetical protein